MDTDERTLDINMYQSVYKILLKMFKDRGYENVDALKNELDIKKIESFIDQIDDSGLDIYNTKVKDLQGKEIYVKFVNKNITNLTEYTNINLPLFSKGKKSKDKEKIHRIYIYYEDKKTTSSGNKKKTYGRYLSKYVDIMLERSDVEFINIEKLNADPVYHNLQPIFKLYRKSFDANKIKEIYESYSTLEAGKSHFPTMNFDDVVNLYYAGRPDDLFEIDRNNTIYYRTVTIKRTV